MNAPAAAQLMSGDEFRDSLRRYKPRVFVDGRRIESVADDPVLRPGINAIGLKQYAEAHREFDAYERTLPGDPNAEFFKGVALESMNDRQGAGREYRRYVSSVGSGQQAQYAEARLRAWGMLR